MTSGRTARKKGVQFEHDVAVYIADRLPVWEVRRKNKSGHAGNDLELDLDAKFETGGVLLGGEVKNQQRLDLPGWHAQAEADRERADVVAVFHRRARVSDVGRSWVTMSLDDFCHLLDRLT